MMFENKDKVWATLFASSLNAFLISTFAESRAGAHKATIEDLRAIAISQAAKAADDAMSEYARRWQ